MATFKDVINKLEENKGDNRQAFIQQTQELSKVFSDVQKTQNRSFGQSLSLQNSKLVTPLNEMVKTLQSLTSSLGGTNKVESVQTAEIEEGSDQEVSSLGSIYDVLVSIDTSFKEYFGLEQRRADEAERKATLGEKAKAAGTAVVSVGKEGTKKGFGALLGAGALMGAALKGVSGIATMGVAISAFFGGLVVGNEALEFARNQGYGDFDFNATKAAAKGFSEIVQELSPEAMIALGGIIGAASFASKGGGSAIKMAVSVGIMGAAITAFFGGLLLGDSVLEGISVLTGAADFAGFKKVIAGFESVISEMSTTTMVVLGTLIGAAAVASTKGGPLKGQAMGMAIATLGLAISGFFVGLVAGDALLEGVSVLSGSLNLEGLKTVVAGFGDIVGSLDTQTLTALGVLFGLSFITAKFGTAKDALKVGLGMTALGAGIAGFFVGLAAGDAAMSWLGGDFTALPNAIKNFSDAIGSLSTESLAILGGMLAAGGILGAIGGAGGSAKVAAGMTAIGAGIAGFMIALAGADFVAKVAGDGSSVKALVVNFGEAISSLDKTALIALGGLLAAGAVFGPAGGAAAAVGMTVIGAGIAGFFLAFEGLAAIGNLIGLDGSNTKNLIINMSDGLKSLDGLDGSNLISLSKALGLIGPAILLFLGSEGIAGVAQYVTDTLKGAWNWLTGNDDEGEKGQTIIDQMVELLKPVEELNNVDLDGFLETTNALTEFINNDYMKGADDFEYFVNKLVANVPKLESAVFGDDQTFGLANGSGSYVQASKNIRMLRSALGESMEENADMRMGGNLSGSNTVVTSQADNSTNTTVNNRSTVSMNTSASNHERTIEAMNIANGSHYSLTPGEDF